MATTLKEVEDLAKTKMENALTALQHDLSVIRSGRASVSILDHIRVDYYGTFTALNQVANLHVPEPSMITITPWDHAVIGAIEKAIRNSDLGLNPSNDGKVVRIPVPPLNEERRKEFVKRLHGIAEDHRVSVRNVRRDANDQFKKLFKEKLISEDAERAAQADVQKMTDSYISKIDAGAKSKEKEIMSV
jgi:ribosome recycling factor